MTRQFTQKLADRDGRFEPTSCLASFVESNNIFRLTLFTRSIDEEYYSVPASSITLNGEKSIKFLFNYLLKLEKKFGFFTEKSIIKTDSYNPSTLFSKDTTIITYLKGGNLILMESEHITENYHIPTKEIQIGTKGIYNLYYLLSHVFGTPIFMKPSTLDQPLEKTIKVPKDKSTAGWELLK